MPNYRTKALKQLLLTKLQEVRLKTFEMNGKLESLGKEENR